SRDWSSDVCSSDLLASDCQHHVLFPRLVMADGARVFTAVTGIESNNDIPLAGLAHRAGRRLRQGRSAWLGRGRQVRSRLVVIEVDHQSVAVLPVRERKRL